MTQLDRLIELLTDPTHANIETHDQLTGACSECPVPLHYRPPEEIAQAILDAGWTPPTITAPAPPCCPNPQEVDTSTYEDFGRAPTTWVCGCRPHCGLTVSPTN